MSTDVRSAAENITKPQRVGYSSIELETQHVGALSRRYYDRRESNTVPSEYLVSEKRWLDMLEIGDSCCPLKTVPTRSTAALSDDPRGCIPKDVHLPEISPLSRRLNLVEKASVGLDGAVESLKRGVTAFPLDSIRLLPPACSCCCRAVP